MFWYIVLAVVIVIAFGRSGFRSAESSLLMAQVATEPDPMVRMQKVQMITQLDNIQDDFLRQKVITSIIQK